MTRNEYIASIMLEAADLLREDSSDNLIKFHGKEIDIWGNNVSIEQLKNDIKILNKNWDKIYEGLLNDALETAQMSNKKQPEINLNYIKSHLKYTDCKYESSNNRSEFEIIYDPTTKILFGDHYYVIHVCIKNNNISDIEYEFQG